MVDNITSQGFNLIFNYDSNTNRPKNLQLNISTNNNFSDFVPGYNSSP